jgi:hypothetical protein
MLRTLSLVLLATVVLVTAGQADDKKKAPANKKPLGTWSRKVGETTITFTIKADDMTIKVVEGGGNSIALEASYGVTKDKVLFGIITKVDNKGLKADVEKGFLFSVRFDISKSELTISDLKGTKADDTIRGTVEGVYAKE